MRVHVLPSEHWIDDDAYATIVDVAASAEEDVRSLLPTLADDLYLLAHQTNVVIFETGDGSYTIGPQCIRWDVDPTRDVATVARSHLRTTLFHECHHAVRLQRRPGEATVVVWPTVTVFEGLASVFEDAAGAPLATFRRYDEAVIADWTRELFEQPVDDSWMQWKFDHPDGRKNIAYKVGTWIAERAIARSKRSAADLVWESPAKVIELAGITT